jgi:hypothetical protein
LLFLVNSFFEALSVPDGNMQAENAPVPAGFAVWGLSPSFGAASRYAERRKWRNELQVPLENHAA